MGLRALRLQSEVPQSLQITTLDRVYGPYATLGLGQDMVYGLDFQVHLVLKEVRRGMVL